MTTNLDNLLIRPFRAEDQVASKTLILSGLQERWGILDPTKNPDLDDIATTYADATFVVAWLGDQLIGTGALTPEADGVGRIERMSVAPHLRRRGIGRRILLWLLQHARSVGYHQIVLETTSTWHDAIAFYQYNGFQIIGSCDGDTHFVLNLS